MVIASLFLACEKKPEVVRDQPSVQKKRAYPDSSFLNKPRPKRGL
jgi:hypothetical protein